MRDWKEVLKKVWHFLWYEDSLLSWITSIALAFILIKFLIYPALGLVMGTQFPVVAVVSDSMEHDSGFDSWWAKQEDLYLRYNITKDEFRSYPLRNGFDKGDIIILTGKDYREIERGDIIVFWGGKAYPIIHRVVKANTLEPIPRYETKGDNNLGQIITPQLDERNVPAYVPCTTDPDGECEVVLGRAVMRIPFLGWVKIGFVEILQGLGIPVA